MTAPEVLPSLSELQAWPTEHFTAIADWCDAEAGRWERSFTTGHRFVENADWAGRAHDTAVRRMELDLNKARGGGEQLRDAGKILRWLGENEQFAKAAALRVVADAEAAEYVVSEDLSVTDTVIYTSWEQATARRAMARGFAADIRAEAASLIRIDRDIADRLPAIGTALREIRFTETPLYAGNRVQLVGNHHPLSPGGGIRPVDNEEVVGADGGAGGKSTDPHPDYPGRDASGRFTSGNTGSADGAAAAEKRLKEYEDEHGTSLIRQQIRVAITDPNTGQTLLDPQTGKPLYRYYDALEPLPGQPGKYRGIEVKSGGANLTRTQRIFDNTVTPEMPATGTLNGQPVEVIDADELRTPGFVPPQAGLDGGAGSAPIISRAPVSLPVLEHPPVEVPQVQAGHGPPVELPPTVFDHPPVQVPPMVLDHPASAPPVVINMPHPPPPEAVAGAGVLATVAGIMGWIAHPTGIFGR